MYFGRAPASYGGLDRDEVDLIEQLAYQTRLGNFDQTETIWGRLRSLGSLNFSKLIGRVDSLSKQSRYGDVSTMIEEALADDRASYSQKQTSALRLWLSYTRIFTRGALRYAIEQAQGVTNWLYPLVSPEEVDLEMIVIEIWLQTMRHARTNSSYVKDLVLGFGLVASASSKEIIGFDGYCQKLETSGHFWELLTTIKILVAWRHPNSTTNAYVHCLEVLERADQTSHVLSCLTATRLAFARHLMAQNDMSRCRNQLSEIDRLFQRSNRSDVPFLGSRQRLELDMLRLNLHDPSKPLGTSYEEWHQMSTRCEHAFEYGLQSDCVSRCIDLCIAGNDYKQLRALMPIAIRVDRVLKCDMPTCLQNMCKSWQPQSQESSGQLLTWFEAFEEDYPISNFFSVPTQQASEQNRWDAPHERERMERIRFHLYKRSGSTRLAKKALKRASSISPYVIDMMSAPLGQAGSWFFEFMNPEGVYYRATDVLTNRLRLGPATDVDSAVYDRAAQSILGVNGGSSGDISEQAANLQVGQVMQSLFVDPRDAHPLEQRLVPIEEWFSTDPGLSQAASVAVLAQLRWEYIDFAARFYKPPLELMAGLHHKFYLYASRITDSSVRQYFDRLAIQSRQAYSDIRLEVYWPDCTAQLLRELKAEYVAILDVYRNTRLSEEYDRISTLLARLGEVSILLREDDSYLERFKDFYDEADQSFNTMRAKMRALPAGRSFEVRAGSKGAPFGYQELLHRAVSCLVHEYQRLTAANEPVEAVATLLWDFVQRGKSRALLDNLSSLGRTKKPMPSTTVSNEARPEYKDDGDDDSGESVSNDEDTPESVEVKPQAHLTVLEASDRLDVARLASARLRRGQSAVTASSSSDGRPATADRDSGEGQPNASAKSSVLISQGAAGNAPSILEEPKPDETDGYLNGRTVTTKDMTAAFAETGPGLVVVDWFVANRGKLINVPHLMIFRPSQTPPTPLVFQLDLAIGRNAELWTSSSLHQKLKKTTADQAYRDLQALQPLVADLAQVTKRDETLIFCPTSSWNIHRVPLHALELNDGSDGPSRERLLVWRNRIAYTYNHSFTHLATRTRQPQLRQDPVPWKAAVMSPLSKLPRGSNNQLIGPLSTPHTRLVNSVVKALAAALSAESSEAKDTTTTAVVQAIDRADFFYFLGHVHGEFGEATNPLAQHLMLYHKKANPPCLPNAQHEEGTFLSAEAVLANCKMKEGAHAMLIACGSGTSEYAAVDEPLGLVTAFLCAGAASVVNTMWNIHPKDATRWTELYAKAWAEERERIRGESAGGSIDLLQCFQEATKEIIRSEGEEGQKALVSWAGFMHSGYWAMNVPIGKAE